MGAIKPKDLKSLKEGSQNQFKGHDLCLKEKNLSFNNKFDFYFALKLYCRVHHIANILSS
jgi:hypothetical protein